MNKSEKKFQFSKLITLFTIFIFLGSLIRGFMVNFESVIDVSFYVTTITVSGGMTGTCIVWMLKKSQAENVLKIQLAYYQGVMKAKLEYDEKKIKLAKKYNISENEIEEIERDFIFNEISESALNNGISNLEQRANEAQEDTEIQIYN